MVVDARIYEVVLLGATGYTGKLCAEHIATHLPTNLKWAIAGRNATKIQTVVDTLKTVNADRPSPDIEVSTHDDESLDALAKKTRLIITTVGPYAVHGEPVVKACANNGTHYLDCTGEIPWVYDMVEKYHDKAKETGAIIIPHCGIDSIPSDILAYLSATYIRQHFSSPTLTSTTSLHNIKAQASGGTLSTVLTIFETYPLSYLAKTFRPYSISPIPAPSPKPTNPLSPSLLSKIAGVHHHPDLGHLTISLQGSTDICIVYRTWGLLSLLSPSTSYGPQFHYSEYMRISSFLRGLLFSLSIGILGIALTLAPCRYLLRNFYFLKPGQGPDVTTAKESDFVHYKNVSVADGPRKEKVQSELRFQGSLYDFTALTLAEAAMVLCRPEEKGGPCAARRLGGGILTTACLGEEFVERMKSAGVKIEVGELK